MVTQTTFRPTEKSKPRGSVPHQIADLVYVAAQMVLPVALGVALVAVGLRSESLAPLISWLISEPLRPLGIALLALGVSLMVDAVSPCRDARTDADDATG